jgi:hypothetical protein
MERLAQGSFVRAFRTYLSNQEAQRAKQAVIEQIPKQGTWFFCEVDGQDYAIRVLHTGSVEVMHSIFSQKQKEALALPLFRED